MEYIAIEKEGFDSLLEKINELTLGIKQWENDTKRDNWIENSELCKLLGISSRTLQNYRQRGVLGFSTIGRKIYYKIEDIQKLIVEKGISAVNTRELFNK